MAYIKAANKIVVKVGVLSKIAEKSLEETVCDYIRENEQVTGEGLTLEHLNRPHNFRHSKKPHGKNCQRRLHELLKEMPSLVQIEWMGFIAFKLADNLPAPVPTEDMLSVSVLQQHPKDPSHALESLEQAVCKYLRNNSKKGEGLFLSHLNCRSSFQHRDKPTGTGCQKRLDKLLSAMESLEKEEWYGEVVFKLAEKPKKQIVAENRQNGGEEIEKRKKEETNGAHEGQQPKKRKKNTKTFSLLHEVLQDPSSLIITTGITPTKDCSFLRW